jgi:hypothetical protein
MKRTTLGKILRIVAIVLMGFSAAVTLLSGIGLTCVALAPEKYASMAALVPYKWLYQLSLLITIAIAVYAIRATVGLARSRNWGYKAAVIALALTIVFGAAHVFMSQTLRGKSMPNDMRVYVAVLALIVLLLLRIPGIWKQVIFSGGGAGGAGTAPAGLSMILAALAFLTVQFWAGATHTWEGVNFADAFHNQLTLVGWALMILGVGFVAWPKLAGIAQSAKEKKVLYRLDRL